MLTPTPPDTRTYQVLCLKQTGDGESVHVTFAMPIGDADEKTVAELHKRLGVAWSVLEGRMRANNDAVLAERDRAAAEHAALVRQLEHQAAAEERINAAQAAREGANGGDSAGTLHPPTDP